VPHHSDPSRVNIRKRAKVSEACECIAELIVLEEFLLYKVPRFFSARQERRVHSIPARNTLSARQAVSTSEKIEKRVAVFHENRPEQFRMTLIGTPGSVGTRCMSAPVIEQDGGKRTATFGAPQQRPELKVAAPYEHGVRPRCPDLAADRGPKDYQESQNLRTSS
jgi:hypothetical protein